MTDAQIQYIDNMDLKHKLDLCSDIDCLERDIFQLMRIN